MRNKLSVGFLVFLFIVEALVFYGYAFSFHFQYAKLGYELAEATTLLEIKLTYVISLAVIMIITVQILCLVLIYNWLNEKKQSD